MKNINLEIKEGNEIYIKSVTENCEVFTHKFHDNVEYAKINGEKISFSNKNEKEKKGTTEIEKWFKNQNFEIIYDFWKDDYSYLEETIKINMRLSEYGLTHSCALDINKRYRHTSLENKIKSYTVAASDARMEGVNLPAMSLCGSGNHGIAATLPVFIYGKEKGFNESEIYKAVGLSMMITTYVKLHIGRLSPICGAAFASGCGVAGAVTYLETKNREKSNNAISFMIETIMGVLCDGAKMGCSLKVLLGVENALNASKLAINDIKTYEDGILDRNITQSIKNLEKITTAMFPVDKAITEIMKKKVLN
jgi:L-cysteine desulfidase